MWTNWAGTVRASPNRTIWPASEAEVQEAIRTSTGPIKAVGSGHSFTSIAATDGLMVHLDRMSGLVGVDHEACTATVLAGTTIARTNVLLGGHGLALSNLGDIDRQAVAGAIATGTHGTGSRFTGLAGQVVALDLVTAEGEVRRLAGGDTFDAARVGLGALGIVTAVTFRCEPAFLLRAVDRPAGLEETLDGYEDWIGSHDHAEFFWFPHTRRVLTKTSDRVHGPARSLSRGRAWFEDDFMANTVLEQANRLGTRYPRAIPVINAMTVRGLTSREYSDTSHRVFCSPRRVVFPETEFAIPRPALRHVLIEAQRWLATHDEHITAPVEVRAAAGDDAWLSMAYQRDIVYVAFHQFVRRDERRWFAAVEAVMREVGGRPHWGKLHNLAADDLAPRYPRFADFLAVREALDPERRFTNTYLRRVLGS